MQCLRYAVQRRTLSGADVARRKFAAIEGEPSITICRAPDCALEHNGDDILGKGSDP